MPPGPPPMPEVVWADQEPERLDGSLQERLDHWMTLVHRGNVLEAYRVFLGLMENPSERKAVLAQLVHAGLMDVQDRALYNRSYTTGHKAFRARATVDLGNFLGWDDAHNVVYAGALDVAVGPRWYSTYEMACNAVQLFLEGATISAIPYGGVTEAEANILANNKEPLSPEEQTGFEKAVIRDAEPGYVELAEDWQEPAPHSRCAAGRLGSGHPRNARRQQFLAAAALLRVPQHDGVVLR
jgi:hypothetical protein